MYHISMVYNCYNYKINNAGHSSFNSFCLNLGNLFFSANCYMSMHITLVLEFPLLLPCGCSYPSTECLSPAPSEVIILIYWGFSLTNSCTISENCVNMISAKTHVANDTYIKGSAKTLLMRNDYMILCFNTIIQCSGEVACLSLGGANTQTAAPPPPPPPRTQTHILPEFLISLQGRMQFFERRGGFHINNWRKGGARASRAKMFVVHVLIFPQIVLETKAINTNK